MATRKPIALKLDGRRRVPHLDSLAADGDYGIAREAAEKRTKDIIGELNDLQELLYVTRQRSVLVVLQGRDAGGKDGTIRKVLGRLNAQSCSVSAFSAPNTLERSHDFLWRIHAQTPMAGTIKVFNRSHYEDVLAVRVRNLAPPAVWKRRYEHINAFESLLSDAGTIVVKFFLHISKDEQAKRLAERADDPLKHWKLSAEDWTDRKLWSRYSEAYQDVFKHCSTPQAPWHLVPANNKWLRNLAVAETLLATLKPFRAQWEREVKAAGAPALAAFRKAQKG